MAGPPTSSFCQINFNFSGPALAYPATCTAGFNVPPGDPDAAASAIAALAGALHDQISTTTVTLDEIVMKVGPEETGPSFQSVVGLAGNVTTDSCGPNTALLIRKVPQAVSGRFAGRMYWPGVPATWVAEDGSLLTSGFITAQFAVTEFLSAMDDDLEMEPYIFSSLSSDPRKVIAYGVQQQVGTQRRRNRR